MSAHAFLVFLIILTDFFHIIILFQQQKIVVHLTLQAMDL